MNNELICPKCKRSNIRLQETYYWCDDCHNSSEINEVKNQNLQKIKIPKPPLSRVIRIGCGYRCINCGSSMPKSGFMSLWGERLCANKKCPNSKSRYYKL